MKTQSKLADILDQTWNGSFRVYSMPLKGNKQACSLMPITNNLVFWREREDDSKLVITRDSNAVHFFYFFTAVILASSSMIVKWNMKGAVLALSLWHTISQSNCTTLKLTFLRAPKWTNFRINSKLESQRMW